MTQIHLHAEPGDYAPVVLLPGDPNRATRIAERFDGGLEASRLVNANRGLLGYTGTVEGVPVSVQTTMMGAPTTSIVMEELLNLGATTFIRVGTCGGFGALDIGDVVVALAAASSGGIGRDAGCRRADRPDRRLRGRRGAAGGQPGAGPDDPRRADRHDRRVLRPASRRRRPLGSARLPRGGDGDRGGVSARDARARQGSGCPGRHDPHGVGRDPRSGGGGAGRASSAARTGTGRRRTRSFAGSI